MKIGLIDGEWDIDSFVMLYQKKFVMPYRKTPYLNALAHWVDNKMTFNSNKDWDSYIHGLNNYGKIIHEIGQLSHGIIP